MTERGGRRMWCGPRHNHRGDESPCNSLQCVMSENWLPDQTRDCSVCIYPVRPTHAPLQHSETCNRFCRVCMYVLQIQFNNSLTWEGEPLGSHCGALSGETVERCWWDDSCPGGVTSAPGLGDISSEEYSFSFNCRGMILSVLLSALAFHLCRDPSGKARELGQGRAGRQREAELELKWSSEITEISRGSKNKYQGGEAELDYLSAVMCSPGLVAHLIRLKLITQSTSLRIV